MPDAAATSHGPGAGTVQRDGFVFAVDTLDSLGLASGVDFEADVLKALQRWVGTGDTVIDVGANIGYFTAHMARGVGPRGRVHAFEPDPANLELLRRNVVGNALAQVTVHGVALGAHEGQALLYRSEFNGGMHRLYDSICCAGETVDVPLRRLDDLFEPGEVALIKIDVEGYEPHVLAGARGLLQHEDIVLVSEYCPASIMEAGAEPSRFLADLEAQGLCAHEPNGTPVPWSALRADAALYEGFGRPRFFEACQGQDNPGIAATIARIAASLGCRRPVIENLVFRRP